MAALPDVPRMVRDAVFVGVGLGLLGVNQLQVRRRELTADLRRLTAGGPLSGLLGGEATDGEPADRRPAGHGPGGRGSGGAAAAG